MSSQELQVGQYVKSKAGRDKDRIFIIIKIVNEQYVQIADGNTRTLEKPKTKKVKHLKPLSLISELTVQAIHNGTNPTNSMLKKEISGASMSSSKEE